MFNKDKFLSFYKGQSNEKDASLCYDEVQKALTDLGIYSDLTMVGAIATIRTEVGRTFKPITEYADGTQYEGRKDLGNILTGDGIKYKGRGFIQLTGRTNYENYSKKLCLDLVNHPDIALCPDTSARILAQYFKDNKIDIDCNAQNWELVRKKVNGGTNGLDVFLSKVKDYLS